MRCFPANFDQYSHVWRIVETRGGAFPLVAVQFKAKAVLQRYKPNMNVKATISFVL